MNADEIAKKSPNEIFPHKELSASYCEQVFEIKAGLTAAFGIGEQKFGVFKISDKKCFPSAPEKIINAPYLVVQLNNHNKVIPTRYRELNEGEISIIGREHEGSFTLDKKVSRKHVEVSLLNGVVSIKDLGSTYGTKDIFNEIQRSIVEVAIPMIKNEIKNIFSGLEQNERKKQKEQKAKLNKEVDTRKNEIIGQDKKVGLYESNRKYSTKKGAKIIIASDKGIGYKNHNEDRVVVVPDAESVSVVDGVGGNSGGEIAAQILAENLSDNSYDIEESTKKASKGIDEAFQKGIIDKKDAAAAFISARIIRGRLKTELEYSYTGDCSLIVIGQNGKLKHISKTDSYISSSLYAKNNGRSLSEDELLYHPQRNIISNKIDAQENKITTKKVRVNKGDMVILMSDGISDNLTPDEIAKLIKGQNPADALKIIDMITSERMKNYEDIIKKTELPFNPRFDIITNLTTIGRRKTGKYSDGRKSMPKKDNRGIAIMEV